MSWCHGAMTLKQYQGYQPQWRNCFRYTSNNAVSKASPDLAGWCHIKACLGWLKIWRCEDAWGAWKPVGQLHTYKIFLEIFHYQNELTTLIYNTKFKHRSVKLQKHGTFTKHFVWSCLVYKLPNPHLPLSPHLPILIPSDLLCCYVFMLHGSSTKLFNKSSAVPMFHHITLPCCHPATQKPLPSKNPPKKKNCFPRPMGISFY